MDSVPPQNRALGSTDRKAWAARWFAGPERLTAHWVTFPIAVIDAVHHRVAGHVVFRIRISATPCNGLATDHGCQRLGSDIVTKVAPRWQRRSANTAPNVVVLIEPDSALRDHRGATPTMARITSRSARIGSLSDVWNLGAADALLRSLLVVCRIAARDCQHQEA